MDKVALAFAVLNPKKRYQTINTVVADTPRMVCDGSYLEDTKIPTFQVRLEDGTEQNQIIATQYLLDNWKTTNDLYRAQQQE